MALLHICPGPVYLNKGSSPLSALRLAFLLTSIFLVIEFVGGLYTHSLALIADAGHMLVDSAALGLSLFAFWFSCRPATATKTYGFYRVEILAALFNGVILIIVSFGIFYESYHRLMHPPEIESGWMLIIAALGLVINLISAYFLHGAQFSNLNVRGAFLHVASDALSSVGAIIAGVIMASMGWYLADPLASLLVATLISYNAWRLVRDSVNVLLEGTPVHINLDAVHDELVRVKDVDSIHDLHIWTLTSGFYAMSCHAVVANTGRRHQILEELRTIIRDQFRIDHSTIQLEEKTLQHHEINPCHSTIQ